MMENRGDDARVCSKIVQTVLTTELKCGHCGAINFFHDYYYPNDTDSSKLDIEAVTCWSCRKDSLIDESLLEMYPLGTKEMVETVEGQSSEN